ncbi:hypothetical protein Tco_1340898, partial [Tanacetum coccineum]
DVNDGLGNLDDYLILYDDLEKEERRFKERVTITEYEQDVLLQPNESMSQAYERIFREMNKGLDTAYPVVWIQRIDFLYSYHF